MTRYKIIGTVAIRQPGEPGDKYLDHEEIIEAESPSEAIDLSLTGFSEEQEPVWCKGYKVTPIKEKRK